jgi:N-acetyl sugar amidotransferase
MIKDNYRQCVRCVMDTTTSYIVFDEKGVCNFCKNYEKSLYEVVFQYTLEERTQKLNVLLDKIKVEGKNKPYDCILGISGGMDSSYLCILAKEWGLRPLIVHFDNGWNSDLAVTNINNIINKLNLELYTYVINWEQFKDLQLSYFKASVLDIEVPNDQLIFATLFKVAKEKGIKNIISGNNIFTEEILPYDWAFHHKFDLTNLRNIHDKFGERDIKGFPTLSLKDRIKYKRQGFEIHTVFQYIDYKHHEIKERLEKEFNYVFYECKHFESIFTRFYQGYILPKKWNIDKRKAHLSCMVIAGFIKREEALNELSHPPYAIEKQLEDKRYVSKKWDLTLEQFEEILSREPVSHDIYGYDKPPFFKRVSKKIELIYKYQILKRLGLLNKS